MAGTPQRTLLDATVPRLTGMLRLLTVEGAGAAPDLGSLEMDRRSALRRKQAAAERERASARATWTAYARALEVEDDSRLTETARERHAALLSALREMLGEGASHDDLADALQFVVVALKPDPDAPDEDEESEAERRARTDAIWESITNRYGHVAKHVSGEITRVVALLWGWIIRLGVQDDPAPETEVERPEFGEDDIELTPVRSWRSYQRDARRARLRERLVGKKNKARARQARRAAQARAGATATVTATPGGGGTDVWSGGAAGSSSAAGGWREPSAGDAGGTSSAVKDVLWLREACEARVAEQGDAAAMSGEELCIQVFRILNNTESEAALQQELFSMLGMEALDLIGDLIQNQTAILNSSVSILDISPTLQAALAKASTPAPAAPPADDDRGASDAGAPMQQVTIMTESQKRAERERRKQARRAGRVAASAEANGSGQTTEEELLTAMGIDVDAVRRDREAELQRNASRTGVRAVSAGAGGGAGLEVKRSLPSNTVRIEHSNYEEVYIPAVKRAPFGQNERLIPVDEFPKWAQVTFGGIERLNRVQSRVYEAAFSRNENLLIAAPTGAGKTNVALMTMLHEISRHRVGSLILKDEFKIVYIAPMKALAGEVTTSFSKRLGPLGLKVRELTGDTQLSKKEMDETQMIVSTPEKWDVITRKSGDNGLGSKVKLLILDEIHLLNSDRGPVLESLVSRTLRLVESTQSMIRIVGLSATLPNYLDVAEFLRVNSETGLYYFGPQYRPVPLDQTFIGVSRVPNKRAVQDTICYDKVSEAVATGKQVLVFVHSRKGTVRTAEAMVDIANKRGQIEIFTEDEPDDTTRRQLSKSRNQELRQLAQHGFAMHHAGMVRSDRNLSEKLFASGAVKVLCATATLAWGVNMPADVVIIHGTQLYNAERGGFVQVDLLDVLQCFGRSGRPGFSAKGHAIMITDRGDLGHYLSLLTSAVPIESQFSKFMVDALNAEIVLGTVANVEEAVQWLRYTYLFTRMRKSPTAYGIPYQDAIDDPGLVSHRHRLIVSAVEKLDRARMIRYERRTGSLHAVDLGRTASHFYLRATSIETFMETLNANITDDGLLDLIAQSDEFSSIRVREEELKDLETLKKTACPIHVKGGETHESGKISILLQAYISRARLRQFSLMSDTHYIVQNSSRIVRGLFEIALKKGWIPLADKLLLLGKEIEHQLWEAYEHPLRQFRDLSTEAIMQIEQRRVTLDRLAVMDNAELGALVRSKRVGKVVRDYIERFPHVELEVEVRPITASILKVNLGVTGVFNWVDRYHTSVMPWWVWVTDVEQTLLHSEYYMMRKKDYRNTVWLSFVIPISAPRPSQIFIRVVSDRWIEAEVWTAIDMDDLLLPEEAPPHTPLLDLQPLATAQVLGNELYEELFKFGFFNALQTQAFFNLYNTDDNVFVGAPTGSGKTNCGLLAVLRLLTAHPKKKAVYVAPMKALVNERVMDWTERLGKTLGLRVVELTGDTAPDARALNNADILVTTPEKLDGVSRHWRQRSYVGNIGLLVFDELHLLGSERGGVLEVLASRFNYIGTQRHSAVRIVGLSTALANAHDVAAWLNIKPACTYNFHPSVRPVQVDVHISGFEGKSYSLRMEKMNPAVYAAINTHAAAEKKPTIVFVSSRRQTRLTAQALITYCTRDDFGARKFLHMEPEEMEMLITQIRDKDLRETLRFGIGLHHGGLSRRDRDKVEELFRARRIQILVATSTLAWGVNTPTHTVVIKSTVFYDWKAGRYAQLPLTDLIQMVGRAGRPGYDDEGKAVILCQNEYKAFLRRFLYGGFPLESSLLGILHDTVNAEVVNGTITSKADCVDWLTWTFLFRRVVKNPSYYGLPSTAPEDLNAFLSDIVDGVVSDLEGNECLTVGEDGIALEPTTMGRIASYYYLSHETMGTFSYRLDENASFADLISALCEASEYDDLPVRGAEADVNAVLSQEVRFPVAAALLDDPHAKANILLQAHIGQTDLPTSDHFSDTKSMLDQIIRIAQAAIDVVADQGWLPAALRLMALVQCTLQARWFDESPLMTLPGMTDAAVAALEDEDGGSGPFSLADLVDMPPKRARDILAKALGDASGGGGGGGRRGRNGGGNKGQRADKMVKVLGQLPSVAVTLGRTDARIEADTELVLKVNIREKGNGKGRRGGRGGRAYTPHFPKPRPAGWWLILGDAEAGDLYALKRVKLNGRQTSTSLVFYAPEENGMVNMTLYLVSDTYLGLDQEVPFSFEVYGGEDVSSESSASYYSSDDDGDDDGDGDDGDGGDDDGSAEDLFGSSSGSEDYA